MGLSWDEVDGIMQRAVRGLERREVQAPQRIGVDETSFQKRHEYVTNDPGMCCTWPTRSRWRSSTNSSTVSS